MSDNTPILPCPVPAVERYHIPPLDIWLAYSEPPPELDFVIKGLLAGTCGALVSQGGVGKSMLALALHALVSIGKTAGNLEIMGVGGTGGCTYLALEDPREVLQGRLHSIARMLAVKHGESAVVAWQQAGRIIPAYGHGIKIGTPVFDDYIKSLSERQRLVIIDTFRRIHDREENGNAEMADLLGFFEGVTRETGTAILLLHHTSKAGAADGSVGARGASAITDNLRFVSTLRPANDKELQAFKVSEEAWRHVVYEVSKCNYAAPQEPIWLLKSLEAKGVMESIGQLQSVLRGAVQSPAKQRQHDNSGCYTDDDF